MPHDAHPQDHITPASQLCGDPFDSLESFFPLPHFPAGADGPSLIASQEPCATVALPIVCLPGSHLVVLHLDGMCTPLLLLHTYPVSVHPRLPFISGWMHTGLVNAFVAVLLWTAPAGVLCACVGASPDSFQSGRALFASPKVCLLLMPPMFRALPTSVAAHVLRPVAGEGIPILIPLNWCEVLNVLRYPWWIQHTMALSPSPDGLSVVATSGSQALSHSTLCYSGFLSVVCFALDVLTVIRIFYSGS